MRGRSLKLLGLGLLVGISALTSLHPAVAATVRAVDDDRVSIIVVSGDFELGDEKKFIDVAVSRPDAIVAFNSPGGNLIAGIEIGRAIRLKGYTTVVMNGSVCASACGLAWLGGRRRVLQSKGLVGFHAAYLNGADGPIVTSTGNAVAGAYLNQLGLSTDAIVYVTARKPNDMQWLTIEDARRNGLDVQSLDDGTPSTGTRSADRALSAERFPAEVNWRTQGEWVQAASRSTLSDAIEVAEWIRERNPNTAIFRYRNGWYGVVIGPFSPRRGSFALSSLLMAEEVPDDSLVTNGEAFTSLVWGAPRARVKP